MRITTLFRKLLCVISLFVDSVALDGDSLSVQVRPRWKFPRCGQCGKRAPGYDRSPPRRWKHLPWGRNSVWLTYSPRRVKCRRCGIRTEEVPWADHNSRFTRNFEELVAYLAQVTDKTQVSKLLGISWKAVDAIIGRVVERRLDPGRLDGLAFIGVDEFSYRKRHRYLTVVVSHDRQQVVWAAKGRSAETLKSFFDLLGPDRAKQIAYVTMDMSGGYMKAVQEAVPDAQIVFDRFHVQRLASDAVDEVRRSMVRLVRGTEEARAIKHTRFVLLKKPSNLTKDEKGRLSEVQRSNRRLYRAYLLKETLSSALSYRQPKRAEDALRDWLSWASRSKLPAFVRAARTIRTYFDGVVAYVKTRLTNGLVEGINTRLRMIARRAFGFHSARALIAMLFLTNGGIQHAPPLPSPTRT